MNNIQHDDSGFVALHLASYHGNKSIIDTLMRGGANIYFMNQQDVSMLHVAAQGNSLYSCAYFTNLGLNINQKDKDGATPLFWACLNNSFLVASYLMAKQADINDKDHQSMNCLHYIVSKTTNENFDEAINCIKNLIFYGCQTNLVNAHGYVPQDFRNQDLTQENDQHLKYVLSN